MNNAIICKIIHITPVPDEHWDQICMPSCTQGLTFRLHVCSVCVWGGGGGWVCVKQSEHYTLSVYKCKHIYTQSRKETINYLEIHLSTRVIILLIVARVHHLFNL